MPYHGLPSIQIHYSSCPKKKKTALLAEEEKFENYKNEKVQDRTLFLVNNSKICVQKTTEAAGHILSHLHKVNTDSLNSQLLFKMTSKPSCANL